METISGESNWDLTVRRDADGITVLRCHTPDERAVVPAFIGGLPVSALGSRALSPDAPETAGERIRITCAPSGDKEWNNACLSELTLPRTLRRVGDYALFNCRALKSIRLHDNPVFWGNGVLTNCRELDTIRIFRDGKHDGDGDNGTMAYFAGELNRELDISVVHPGGGQTEDAVILRLIFPEYRESYEENCPAHHFDYVMEGAGYPYRHCFEKRRLRLPEYDGLWEKNPRMEPMTALRLAWWRLRYPEGLRTEAAEAYQRFLCSRVKEAAAWRIRERDMPGLRFLLRRTEPDRETLSLSLSLAREEKWTEAVALLLEEQRRRFPSNPVDRFAL